jgi:prepilin-type N-terminal cleavage/methylation domain-containing protein
MPINPMPAHHQKAGFTLIELIITIIIMSFAAIIIIPYLSAVTHSPDPILREQAIGLGQAMMDEILAKKWDENSPNGGGPICTINESGTGRGNGTYTLDCTFPPSLDPQATIQANLGLDGEASNANDRTLWNDVDDYNFLNQIDDNYEKNNFWAQDGITSAFSMPGFSRWVEVDYITSSASPITATIPAPANADASTDSKRIVVTVKSPLGETFQFVAVSCNF